ncbi:MAG: hypothetical protein IT372_37265 [Polyangiaceae bacterium]|nr:hypothetical protein [Polyangiaceae bacterium]
MEARFLVVVFGAAAILGPACAKASPPAEGAGAGGSASSTTTGGTGGLDDGCLEDPCRLVAPQCGCPAGEQCALIDEDGSRGCVAAGTLPQGAVCSSAECGPGLACVSATATIKTCGKFCETDADCEAPGGLCFFKLDDGMGGEIPGATICSDSCDPSTNSGCAPDLACQLAREPDGEQRYLSVCTGPGAGTAGSPCTVNSDCAPTFGCIGEVDAQTVCEPWCTVGDPCPASLTCTPFSPAVLVGGVEYGACL